MRVMVNPSPVAMIRCRVQEDVVEQTVTCYIFGIYYYSKRYNPLLATLRLCH